MNKDHIMTKDVIFDFETLSQNSRKCVAFECSAFVFDRAKMISDEPYSMRDVTNTKYFKLDTLEQMNEFGFEVEDSTLDFWSKQDKNVRARMKPREGDLTAKEFTTQFIDYLKNEGPVTYWWSRSNTFDPIILERLCEAAGTKNAMDKQLKYWAVRDTRTFIDAATDFEGDNAFVPVRDETFWNKAFVKHDSSWDIIADVLRIQAILRTNNDLEVPNR